MWSETITKTVLDTGLRLLVMRMPQARTVSLGLFVDQGSKDEDVECSGVSHFIEHLVFNPAYVEPETRRSLNRLLDGGATYEAVTGKELTRFTITCQRQDLESAVRCLAGVVKGHLIPDEAVEHERQIILHERDAYFLSGRVRAELIEQALWGNRSLGLYVIGRRENILRFQPGELAARFSRFYTPDNSQVVVYGDVAPEEAGALIAQYFSDWKAETAPRRRILLEAEPNVIALPMDGSRVRLNLAFLAPAFDTPDRYAANLLADVLGGGMKSRLFQALRQERRLCYDVHAYAMAYRLGGYVCVSIDCLKDQVDEVYPLIMSVANDLRQNPVPPEELARVKAGRVTALLSLPNDARRHLEVMGRHAALGRDLFVDLECGEINRVTAEDLLQVAGTVLDVDRMAVAGLGIDPAQIMALL